MQKSIECRGPLELQQPFAWDAGRHHTRDSWLIVQLESSDVGLGAISRDKVHGSLRMSRLMRLEVGVPSLSHASRSSARAGCIYND